MCVGLWKTWSSSAARGSGHGCRDAPDRDGSRGRSWFPDGLETPGLTLIKVNGETAEYWDGPSSAIARLVGLGVAMAKKDPDAFPAENRTVAL